MAIFVVAQSENPGKRIVDRQVEPLALREDNYRLGPDVILFFLKSLQHNDLAHSIVGISGTLRAFGGKM
jgi:hypothetical protein